MTVLKFIIEGKPDGPLPYAENIFELPGEGDGIRLLSWARQPDVYGYPVVEIVDEQKVEREPTNQEVLSRFWTATIKATLASMIRREERVRRESLSPVPEPEVQER